VSFGFDVQKQCFGFDVEQQCLFRKKKTIFLFICHTSFRIQSSQNYSGIYFVSIPN